MNDVAFNKVLNSKYLLLSNIVKKYNYSEELHDMMTYIYLIFYMDLGKQCDSVLYDLFNKVKIIHEPGTMNEIALKHNYGKMPNDCPAVTIFTPNLKVFNDPNLKQKPQVILVSSKTDDAVVTPIFKLEMLLHEVRHALMGYYNNNFLVDKNTYYMRSGIQEVYYRKKEGLEDAFTTKKVGTILSEVVNTYITERYVNKILSLKKYNITNPNLKAYLNSLHTFQSDGIYRSLGYNDMVRLLYPLLLNETFHDITNVHEFDGELSYIKSLIENNTNLCDYEKFCNLIDTIFNGNQVYQTAKAKNDLRFVESHIQNIKLLKKCVLELVKNIDDRKEMKKLIKQ